MVNKDHRRRIDHKPLEAVEGERRGVVAVITTLGGEVIQPIVTDVHDQHAGKRVEAETVIKHIHGKAHDKAYSHQRQGICFYGQHKEVGDIQEAKGRMEEHNVLQDQYLVKKVNEKRYDL